MVDVSVIETSGLGDRSYLVSDGDVAVAVDPQRDFDRVLARADGLRITHVLETHIHNDYVTGGLALARAVGAAYVVPAGEEVQFPCRRVNDGDRIDSGAIHVEVLFTPGHTHHHVSYALRDESDAALGVFTGGSMLIGSTGRTDLVGDEHTEELTRLQYRSVRRLADELPADTPVFPTHGFGSFCSAGSTDSDSDSSTIAEQRATNPALTHDEKAYVEQLLDGLSAYPAYYAHMGVINRAGPAAPDLSPPVPVHPEELRRRIEAGEWVVDLRHRTAFAAGHLAGSYGFELSGSFVNYFGWLYAWDAPLTLIGEDSDQIADAQRELVRIGVERLTGSASGDVDALAAGTPLRSYRVATFDDLAEVLSDAYVLDVREPDEFQDGRVRGAVNIAVHDLPERIAEIPADGDIWIHCASGYRASIAAGLLDRHERHVVLVDDEYANAEKLGITSRRES
jgi:hydroxyacylglutathione hydrolase